jgi:outer membrane protein assembly factor BamB
MRTTTACDAARERPLRLWPGAVIVLLQWTAWLGLPAVDPDYTIYGVLAGLGGLVALLIWWLGFSRAAWSERLGAPILMIAAMAAAWPFLHESIATGATGFLFPLLAIPGVCLAFVLWAVATRHLSTGIRRATMAAAIVVSCGAWTLVRTGGFTGSFENDLAWRWTATPEQRLLAQGDAIPAPPPRMAADAPQGAPEASPAPAASAPAAATADPARLETLSPDAVAARPATPEGRVAPADPPLAPGEPAHEAGATLPAPAWPGFRGADRDGVVRGVRIDTDWSASPPVPIWRRPIGPGWSSFAVQGDLLYTQEQRGDEEIVAAYRVSTGAPVWMHRDAARFWESNGGAGPRGTPTLGQGRLYALGATGILNALDAADGRLLWSRNVGDDSGVSVPDWGFSASPLLAGDVVIVAAAGTLAAYDATTGEPRWVGPRRGAGYSSPHLVTIGGVPQVVLLDAQGATSVAPENGARLWDLEVPSGAMSAPIVQPSVTADGDLLVGDGQARGLYRIAVAHEPEGWAVTQRWMSTGLKPYYNDFVVHKGHAFGFDGSILACIDLADGRRTWKGGRYGNGQLVLLADQDLLLVISEHGELALVSATPDGFTELARIPGIEGKTWNHPVVTGDILLVRNGEEMAAFRLPTARR